MIKPVTIAQCDQCSTETRVDVTDKVVAMTKLLWAGWHLTENQHLCPRCKDDNDKADNNLV